MRADIKQHAIVPRDISELKPWDKNPRTISDEAKARLKQKMQKLGLYKPLITTQDGTVIGGNQRLQVLRELGTEKVWCTLLPDGLDESQLVEIAISDNENDGQWDKKQLVSLIQEVEIDTELFAVQFSTPVRLTELAINGAPDEDENEESTDVAFNESRRRCPECNHVGKTSEFVKEG